MKTYIPDIALCNLCNNTPMHISNVTQSEWNVFAMCKTMKIEGQVYHYFNDTNELIRRDVLLWQAMRDNKITKQQLVIKQYILK